MGNSYMIVIILFLLPFYLIFFKKKSVKLDNLKSYYIKGMFRYVLFITVISIVDTSVIQRVDFSKVGKGYVLPVYLYVVLLLFHIMPFFMAFFPEKEKDLHTPKSKDEIYGVPIKLYPNSYKELTLFILFMISGVVAEEIVYRQFMFQAFNKVLGLTADTLLIVTSTLFTISHLGQVEYRKITRFLIIFISGLFFGKSFQMSGSIYSPIIIHLLTNGVIAVIAFKRLLNTNKKFDIY